MGWLSAVGVSGVDVGRYDEDEDGCYESAVRGCLIHGPG
jgi:hypothetical protein